MKKLTLFIILLFSTSVLLAQKKIGSSEDSTTTYITVNVKNRNTSDTISLTQNGPFYDYLIGATTARYAVNIIGAFRAADGSYHFKLKTSKSPFHISLYLSNKKYDDYLIGSGDVSWYLIMPGSNINIEFNGIERRFSGKGSELLTVQDQIEHTDPGSKILDDHSLLRKDAPEWIARHDSLLNVQLELLKDYKLKIDPLTYSILRADVIGLNRGAMYYWMSYTQPYIAKRVDLSSTLMDGFSKLSQEPNLISGSDPACLSPNYIFYLYNKLKLEVKHDRIMAKIPPRMDQNWFPKIESAYQGALREKLLARWVTELASVNNLHDDDVSKALSLMKNPAFIKIVNDQNRAYRKGDSIVDFSFKDAKGTTVHLADFKGKVIVVDMWFTGCENCIAVVKNMPHVEYQFIDKNVVFVTISIDRDKRVWLKSIDSRDGLYYVSPRTTYLYTAGSGSRNPFIERYVPGNGYPQLMIIGKDGKMFSAAVPHPINENLANALTLEIKKALDAN